ncbi:MAG: hypothetical protein L0Y70_27920, partial [Gemmataceae bacterium]|nr:hypothetical protein [Gemmataceae bacterium]
MARLFRAGPRHHAHQLVEIRKTTLLSLLLARRGRTDASCVGYNPPANPVADAASVGVEPPSDPAASDESCVGNDPVADAASVGAQLADRPVQPGQSIVLSEEDESIWAERSKRLDLGNVFF